MVMDFKAFDESQENRRRMLWDEAQAEIAKLRAELEEALRVVERVAVIPVCRCTELLFINEKCLRCAARSVLAARADGRENG